MPDDDPEPPRKRRWHSKRTKGRASAGLGFDATHYKRAKARARRRKAAEVEAWLKAKG